LMIRKDISYKHELDISARASKGTVHATLKADPTDKMRADKSRGLCQD